MKKYISIIIVLLLVISTAIVPVYAQNVEKTRNVIQFDANTATAWGHNYEKVYCHIWEYNGDSFYLWQSINERCVDDAKDGIWTYDLDEHGIVLEDDKVYCCIFSNENGRLTYDLIFDKTVLGDVAYCTGEYYDSPDESIAYYAYWRNQESTLDGFGPLLSITSIGSLNGTSIPKTTTASEMFEDFLIYKMENARTYSGKSDQEIIDDIATKLEMTQADVINAINNTEEKVSWKWWESTLCGGDFEPVHGDVDGDMTLSIIDATVIQQYKADIVDINEKLLMYGDVDNDENVSVLDATHIQLILAKAI